MIDACYRLLYRLAYPLADFWWCYIQQHEGVSIAVWVDDQVLAVRHSYKPGLRLPGGTTIRGEEHRTTASRELAEEVGVEVDPEDFTHVLTIPTRHGRVHLLETHLIRRPPLTIDRREIIAADFLPPSQVRETSRIADYLATGPVPQTSRDLPAI